ncbi:UNVERIFIED_CONTAM: hypothetical protein GTU68_045210, partial [Idotea baltica]|nr:hypothetical protein [Idotea baltica]
IHTQHQYKLANSFEHFSLEEKSVNLVVTSPPYPMIQMWDEIMGRYDSRIMPAIAKEDGAPAFEYMHELLDRTWKECYRILKPGGFACINIGDATRTLDGKFQLYSNHSRIINACTGLGFSPMPSIIWRKPTNSPTKFMGSGMLPAGAYITLEHEWILVFRKEGKRSFNKEEQILRRQSAMFWEERNKWFCDQWSDVLGTSQKMSPKANRKRSAAYPLEIANRLIAMYSMYGDTVVDPFSGTGTTGLAAIMLGRNSVNFDADESIVEESTLLPTKRDTKGILNTTIATRVTDHMNYVASKDMLFFKYKNSGMGVPIKTQQEKEMYLFAINSISRKEEEVNVKYRKWKKSELQEMILASNLGG